MSELKVASCFEFEKVLRGKSNKLFYPKSEVDAVIAELKAREDVLVTDNRNLLDKVKNIENHLRENAEHYKRNEVQIIENADKEIAGLKARIAELETLNHDLCERVTENDEIRLHWEEIEQTRAENERMKSRIAELEEELEASKRKEKESRELADPYTLYCEASAESLRNALGEYRWRRPCDDLPPEWSCVIVYFHDEESREEQYRLAVYSKENGWEVDDEEVYKTAEIEAWHPLPMPPEEEE